MTEATKQQVEMARRIAAKHRDVAAMDKFYLDGMCDAEIEVQCALTAIIETQRLCADLAAWAHMVPPDGGSPTPEECALAQTIATAIRAGEHYGKVEG